MYISEGFTKFYLKQMLKVSAFYLKKQKKFYSYLKKKNWPVKQNKKALFTDSIFSEDFAVYYLSALLANTFM